MKKILFVFSLVLIIITMNHGNINANTTIQFGSNSGTSASSSLGSSGTLGSWTPFSPYIILNTSNVSLRSPHATPEILNIPDKQNLYFAVSVRKGKTGSFVLTEGSIDSSAPDRWVCFNKTGLEIFDLTRQENWLYGRDNFWNKFQNKTLKMQPGQILMELVENYNTPGQEDMYEGIMNEINKNIEITRNEHGPLHLLTKNRIKMYDAIWFSAKQTPIIEKEKDQKLVIIEVFHRKGESGEDEDVYDADGVLKQFSKSTLYSSTKKYEQYVQNIEKANDKIPPESSIQPKIPMDIEKYYWHNNISSKSVAYESVENELNYNHQIEFHFALLEREVDKNEKPWITNYYIVDEFTEIVDMDYQFDEPEFPEIGLIPFNINRNADVTEINTPNYAWNEISSYMDNANISLNLKSSDANGLPMNGAIETSNLNIPTKFNLYVNGQFGIPGKSQGGINIYSGDPGMNYNAAPSEVVFWNPVLNAGLRGTGGIPLYSLEENGNGNEITAGNIRTYDLSDPLTSSGFMVRAIKENSNGDYGSSGSSYSYFWDMDLEAAMYYRYGKKYSVTGSVRNSATSSTYEIKEDYNIVTNRWKGRKQKSFNFPYAFFEVEAKNLGGYQD